MSAGSQSRKPLDETLVSVVLPIYNEASVLMRLLDLVQSTLECCGCHFEIIFVNDGSADDSARILDELADRDDRIRVLHFSRNFGHQSAVQAGLQHSAGDAVVVMDSDLQDDPSAIPEFLDKWQAGYDVVYAVRVNRKEGFLKRSLFFAFYRILNRISTVPIPKDAGNFGLMDRTVARQVVEVSDRDRFFPGLRRWVGFRQVGIPVERQARYDRQPRVSIVGLCRLAKTAIFSFSSFPLMMFYGIATMSFVVCLALVGFTLYHKLLTGLAVPGWTSLTMAASFFGALNALGIGILGEYVIRIYDQVRSRPQFIVARKRNFQESTSSHSPRDGAMLDWLADQWQDQSETVGVLDAAGRRGAD